MRHIIPISGKDSFATALVQHAKEPGLPYEYVFNPTGLELPEVFEWIERVGKHFNATINIVSKSLSDIIEGYNYFLPQAHARYCTKESKILPFVNWVGKDECKVYYGIRADEQREGFNNNTSPNIQPVYPLQEMGFGLRHVYMIVNKAGLKPPTFFWESVYNEVRRRLDYDPKEVLPEWVFDSLFAWRSRANCDRCFNQRRYEWVGLLEHHPDRFWEAESWEHKGGEKSFTWISGLPLAEVAKKAAQYKQSRIDHIAKIIRLRQQLTFDFMEEGDDFIDILSVKSCGLFCGK